MELGKMVFAVFVLMTGNPFNMWNFRAITYIILIFYNYWLYIKLKTGEFDMLPLHKSLDVTKSGFVDLIFLSYLKLIFLKYPSSFNKAFSIRLHQVRLISSIYFSTIQNILTLSHKPFRI